MSSNQALKEEKIRNKELKLAPKAEEMNDKGLKTGTERRRDEGLGAQTRH